MQHWIWLRKRSAPRCAQRAVANVNKLSGAGKSSLPKTQHKHDAEAQCLFVANLFHVVALSLPSVDAPRLLCLVRTNVQHAASDNAGKPP